MNLFQLGIMLSWNMPDMPFAKVKKYQLFAYQETNMPPTVDLWKAVGDVSALPLPMACTLTQVRISIGIFNDNLKTRSANNIRDDFSVCRRLQVSLYCSSCRCTRKNRAVQFGRKYYSVNM